MRPFPGAKLLQVMHVGNSGRVPLFLEVAAKVSGFPKPLPATVLDLSLAGCRLTVRSVLLIGADIEFQLPLAPNIAPIVRGKVRRCTPTDVPGVLEYGVEFAAFSAKDGPDIQRYIEAEGNRAKAEGRAARIEVDFPVTCIAQGNKNPIPGIAIDLGRGGMRVACETAFPEGTAITMRFTLPNDNGRELVMRGRVVQCKHQFREYHHSTAFLEPDPTSVERIERFVRNR